MSDAPEQPEWRRLCSVVADEAQEEAGCSDAPEQVEKEAEYCCPHAPEQEAECPDHSPEEEAECPHSLVEEDEEAEASSSEG